MDQAQNVPDSMPPSPLGGDDTDVEDVKKVDSFVVASTKTLPYVTDYRHSDTSKINPFKIAQMDLDELYQLRNLVRNTINQNTFSNQFGAYSDPGMRFYQDMLTYVEKVIEAKRVGTKNAKRTEAKPAKFGNKPEPKIAPGEVKRK